MSDVLVDLQAVALQRRLPHGWRATRLADGRLEARRPYRIGKGAEARLRSTDADELVRLAERTERFASST